VTGFLDFPWLTHRLLGNHIKAKHLPFPLVNRVTHSIPTSQTTSTLQALAWGYGGTRHGLHGGVGCLPPCRNHTQATPHFGGIIVKKVMEGVNIYIKNAKRAGRPPPPPCPQNACFTPVMHDCLSLLVTTTTA